MAKLPEIRVRRPIREVRSPEAVNFGVKMRNIGKAVDTARGVADVIDREVDAEAKLDATRRKNNALRTYQTKATQLTQEYHSNRDLPAEGYAQAMDDLRTDSFASAAEGSSVRVGRYLAPQLDQATTSLQGAEREAGIKLMQSRQVMHLNDSIKDSVAMLNQAPEQGAVAWTQVQEEMAASTIPLPIQEDMLSKAASSFLGSSLNAFKRMGGPEGMAGMTSLSQSEAYRHATVAQQQQVDSAITSAASDMKVAAVNEAATNAFRGEWDINRSVAHVSTLVAGWEGLNEAEQAKTIQSAGYDITDAAIKGRLSSMDIKGAQAILDNPDYDHLIDAGKRGQYQNAINSARTTGASISSAYVQLDLSNDLAKAEAGIAVDMTKYASLDTSGWSDSAQASFIKNTARLTEMNNVMQGIGDLSSTPSAGFNYIRQDLATYRGSLNADTTNFKAKTDALDHAETQLSKHTAERQNNPTEYALANDVNTQEAWGGFIRALAAPDAQTETIQTAWGAYANASTAAQTGYGTLPQDVTLIPKSDAFLNAVVTRLDGNYEQVAQSTAMLIGVMGPEGSAQLAETLQAKNPAAAYTMAFGIVGEGSSMEAMYRGSKMMGSVGVPTVKDFEESVASTKILMPIAAMGDYVDATMSAMYTFALGTATPAELTSGSFTIETLTRARDAMTGAPVTINEYANPTVNYRKTEGGWQDPVVTLAQFKTLALRPDTAEELYGLPYFKDAAGNLTSQSWESLMEYATPSMIRNGVYTLDIPLGSDYGTAGKALNAEGKPLEVDLNAMPVMSLQDSRRATLLAENPLGIGAL